jgi:hypothetical protein
MPDLVQSPGQHYHKLTKSEMYELMGNIEAISSKMKHIEKRSASQDPKSEQIPRNIGENRCLDFCSMQVYCNETGSGEYYHFLVYITVANGIVWNKELEDSSSTLWLYTTQNIAIPYVLY